MRLMFASHSSDLAGAELCLVVLVEEATARGHTGVVTVPREGPLVGLLKPYEKCFPIVVLPVRPWMGRRFSGIVGIVRALQALLGSFAFYGLIKSSRFDVVVVNSSVIPAPLIAARASGTKNLLIVRESIISNPTLRSAVPRRMIRRLLSGWATKVVSNSHYIARQFHFESKLVYPELAKSHFEPNRKTPSNSDVSPLRAVMLGTLSPEKGQLDALHAIAQARSLGTVIFLDIYGRGSEKDQKNLETAIIRHGLSDLVRLHAPTRSPKGIFEQADFSIVCSRNEAFGMVTAESILAGTPVIGYNRGGTSEILAGGGGLLVEADSRSLAEALINVDRNRDLIPTMRHECDISGLRDLLIASPTSMLDIIEALGERS